MRYKTSYDFNEKSMESYFMTDEYVERRRAYVNEIRRSFDRSEVENGTAEGITAFGSVDFSENPHSACSSSYARIPSVKI